MRRRNVLTLASEAYYIVDGERIYTTFAELETSWSEEQSKTTEFFCTKCDVPVKPSGLGSTLKSPAFQASRTGDHEGHKSWCPRRPREAGSAKAAPGESVSTVPEKLVLEPKGGEIADGEWVSEPEWRYSNATRTASPALGPGVGARWLRAAHTLELIVNHWIRLGTNESRRAHKLSIPGVDQDNYLHCFKRIALWGGEIKKSEQRVFYAPLRWRDAPVEDGDTVTVKLHVAGRRGAAVICTMHIDMEGWSPAHRQRLHLEIEVAQRIGHELWIENKQKPSQAAPPEVTVFAVAEQDPRDTTVYRVRDIRLIHFTDRQITH